MTWEDWALLNCPQDVRSWRHAAINSADLAHALPPAMSAREAIDDLPDLAGMPAGESSHESSPFLLPSIQSQKIYSKIPFIECL